MANDKTRNELMIFGGSTPPPIYKEVIHMARTTLNDIYYTACNNYTLGVMTGNKSFFEQAKAIFDIYKQNGGKKENLKLI